MRTSIKKLNPSLKKEITRMFAQAISDLKDINETTKFFSDFLNDSEVEGLSKRLAVAYWIKKGRSYNNIKNNLNVSSATVAQVLKDMKKPGFKQLLAKIEAEEWASQWADKIKKFVKK
jgi:TrpR-related protein YerC/YecD